MILRGGIPERPKDAVIPDVVWTLMEKCWAKDASNRATANEAVQTLEHCISGSFL